MQGGRLRTQQGPPGRATAPDSEKTEGPPTSGECGPTKPAALCDIADDERECSCATEDSPESPTTAEVKEGKAQGHQIEAPLKDKTARHDAKLAPHHSSSTKGQQCRPPAKQNLRVEVVPYEDILSSHQSRPRAHAVAGDAASAVNRNLQMLRRSILMLSPVDRDRVPPDEKSQASAQLAPSSESHASRTRRRRHRYRRRAPRRHRNRHRNRRHHRHPHAGEVDQPQPSPSASSVGIVNRDDLSVMSLQSAESGGDSWSSMSSHEGELAERFIQGGRESPSGRRTCPAAVGRGEVRMWADWEDKGSTLMLSQMDTDKEEAADGVLKDARAPAASSDNISADRQSSSPKAAVVEQAVEKPAPRGKSKRSQGFFSSMLGRMQAVLKALSPTSSSAPNRVEKLEPPVATRSRSGETLAPWALHQILDTPGGYDTLLAVSCRRYCAELLMCWRHVRLFKGLHGGIPEKGLSFTFSRRSSAATTATAATTAVSGTISNYSIGTAAGTTGGINNNNSYEDDRASDDGSYDSGTILRRFSSWTSLPAPEECLKLSPSWATEIYERHIKKDSKREINIGDEERRSLDFMERPTEINRVLRQIYSRAGLPLPRKVRDCVLALDGFCPKGNLFDAVLNTSVMMIEDNMCKNQSPPLHDTPEYLEWCKRVNGE